MVHIHTNAYTDTRSVLIKRQSNNNQHDIKIVQSEII